MRRLWEHFNRDRNQLVSFLVIQFAFFCKNLNEVVDRENEISKLSGHIVFCCLSGGRSGQATAYFQGKGISCENGGGWQEVLLKFEQG